MPTGYTDCLKDGSITFPQFAMQCARAFGALISMRDDPSDAAIPDAFDPSDHHATEHAKAKERLAELHMLKPSDCEVHALHAFLAAKEAHNKRLREIAALRSSYEAMLAKVEDWTPPSSDHYGLQKFMKEQIEQSIDFDCGTKYLTEPVQRTGAQWLADEIGKAARDIEYHAREHAAEVDRAAKRTAWVRSLRESLKA
jgi:hypothetical protein